MEWSCDSEVEIKRSFMEWSCEAVCRWVSSLSLSQDYSTNFTDHQITGSTLVSLDREALDNMGITDDSDRLKILQQITSMRADLITSGTASPTRRMRSPTKGRHFSETMQLSSNSGGRCGYHGRRAKTVSRTSSHSPVKQSGRTSQYINVPIRERSLRTPDSGPPIISPISQLSTDHISSDSQESSRMSSPADKFGDIPIAVDHRSGVNKLQAATLSCHNVRRLSRSLDNFFPDGDDIFSVYHRAIQADGKGDYSSSSRLVEILREENASLKQELETYYQRVRKLQKIEQEMEHIREAHRMLEASTVRREGLEKTLRVKYEQEIRRIKEENINLKAEISMARKQTSSDAPSQKGDPNKQELRRRDTMIVRLIKQNKEAAIAREKLEKDLQSTKAQLKQNKHTNTDFAERKPITGSVSNSETDSKIALVYSESIEKLRAVLSAMQSTSQKREKLEKKMRSQLEKQISRLKKEVDGSHVRDEECSDSLAALQIQNTALEADIAKWEHKCLELVAEKQMTFEAAVIPKEARIAALERSLAEKIDALHDLRHQKAAYISQLTEANRQITDFEIRLSSAQSSLKEKDSVIQMMQKSFLEPEEESMSHMQPLSHIPPPKPVYFKRESNSLDEDTGQPGLSSSGSGRYVEGPPDLPPSGWSTGGFSSSPYSMINVSPKNSNPVRASPLASPVVHRTNCRSQSASPVKALNSSTNGVKPRGAPANQNYLHETSSIPQRRGVYINYSPPTSKYLGSSASHTHNSNSMPNSPNVHNIPRRPRISHPNMRFLQVPGPDHVGFRQNYSHNQRKSNTGPGGMRRSNYTPSPSPRAMKSKTPPPDYRLVSVSGGRGSKSESPQLVPKKQCHKSVDNILTDTKGENSSNHTPADYHHSKSLELFQSLIGESMPSSQQGRAQCSRDSREQLHLSTQHRHSESSPTNRQI